MFWDVAVAEVGGAAEAVHALVDQLEAGGVAQEVRVHVGETSPSRRLFQRAAVPLYPQQDDRRPGVPARWCATLLASDRSGQQPPVTTPCPVLPSS